jgi:hypothetical protein
MTFLNYNKYLIENTPITFSRRSRTLGEVSNPTFGWIITIIDYIGIILGCLLCGSVVKGDNEYCDSCNKYKKIKKIFTISKTNGKDFFGELETSVKDMNIDLILDGLISKYTNSDEKRDEYYQCNLVYCESCRTASLNFKLFERNRKNKIEENSDFEYRVNVNYDSVSKYINK